jgi:cysteinyl-tRNA synthetase
MSHYRTKVDWTEHLVQQAHRETIKIQQYLVDWKSFSKNQTHKHSQKNLRNDLSHEFVMVMDQHLKKIQQDLADDLNMPMVLSSFYAVWKMIRKATREMEEWTSEMLMTVEDWIQKSDLLLGLYSSDPQRFLLEQRQNMQKKETQRLLDPEEVDDLISKRAKAKEEKNWPMADSIRKALKEKGVLVKDHPDGTTTWDWE